MSSQPVLAVTDLSEPADEALRQGSEWARLRRVELVVCHVVPSLVGSHVLDPQSIEKEAVQQPLLEAHVADVVRKRSCAVTGRNPDELQVVIAAGTPGTEIPRQAETLGAGLIVVGSHGRAGLSSIFLGSVAEHVVRHAGASVLVARPHKRSERIIVATDLSDAAFAALVVAAEQSQLVGARLTLMCSIRDRLQPILAMTTFGTTYKFVHDEYEELRKSSERELAGLLERAGVAGDTVVADGAPAQELVHLAAELDADLVVIGATGRTGLRGLLGNVAQRVTRHAPCSVLVVRAAPAAGK